ncbi:MAG: phosphoribosylaminoimidazolesuccinocarboxamide synthase [Patescibacteria group bacterium]
MKSRELIHQGSVKDIYEVDAQTLAFVHTNNWSAFDIGRCSQPIPEMGKAVVRATMASNRIATAVGVQTCILEQEDEWTILVRRFNTLKGLALNPGETDVMVSLEWIDREAVSGNLNRDFISGKRKPTDFGFESDGSDKLPTEGTLLPFPSHEVTTKWEDVDRPIATTEEALAYAGITLTEWRSVWRVINRLNGALALAARSAGFTRLDGKKEIALSGRKRHPVVIDSFGTPNEDRYALTKTLKPGQVEHYSKEYLRQLLIEKGFKKALDITRSHGLPNPKYPILTEDEIGEVGRRYRNFAAMYEAGVNRILGSTCRAREIFDAGISQSAGECIY